MIAISNINIYTDGSWSPETENVSGYGFVVVRDEEVLCTGYGQASAESRQILGELSAVMRAIVACSKRKLYKVNIIYDYQGVEQWATGQWKRKKKATKEYKEFIDCVTEKGMDLSFEWTKGHSGNKWNDFADELANLGRVTDEHIIEWKL